MCLNRKSYIVDRFHVGDFAGYVPKWLRQELKSLRVPDTLTNPDNLLSQIVAGLLLGDGYITKQASPNRNCMLDLHCAWKEHNLFMVVSTLLPLYQVGLASGQFVQRSVHRNGQDMFRIRGYSKAHPLFTELRNLWYPGGNKVVPANICDYLSPVALAFWFTGAIAYGGMLGYSELALNTQGFSMPEQTMLQAVLLEKYGLVTRLGQDKSYKRIVIMANSAKSFANLMLPLLPESVHYKLKHVS